MSTFRCCILQATTLLRMPRACHPSRTAWTVSLHRDGLGDCRRPRPRKVVMGCCSRPALAASARCPARIRGVMDHLSPLRRAALPARDSTLTRTDSIHSPRFKLNLYSSSTFENIKPNINARSNFQNSCSCFPDMNGARMQQQGSRAELSSCAAFSLHNLSIFLGWILFHADWCTINWLLKGISEGLSPLAA